MTSKQIAAMDLALRSSLGYDTLNESVRHNKVWEGETNRHNLATEEQGMLSYLEGKRHNLMQERIANTELGERSRHNKAQESLSWSQLGEMRRHNQLTEYNDRVRNYQTYRLGLMHAANERASIDQRKRENDLRAWAETNRYALESARNREHTRHNKVVEGQNWAGQGLEIMKMGVGLLKAAFV